MFLVYYRPTTEIENLSHSKYPAVHYTLSCQLLHLSLYCNTKLIGQVLWEKKMAMLELNIHLNPNIHLNLTTKKVCGGNFVRVFQPLKREGVMTTV